jgi:hypothetical protein
MAITYDFQLISADMAGFTKVVAQNEDAFCYLVDEAEMQTLKDGSAVLFNDRVGDFISDAGHAHMCCELV